MMCAIRDVKMTTPSTVRSTSVAEDREPDVRFTLANERTFLAWIRTVLALMGGGFALAKLLPDARGGTVLAAGLIALGLVVALFSYGRWQSTQLSLRRDEPLRASRLPLVLVVGVIVAGAVAIALVILDAP